MFSALATTLTYETIVVDKYFVARIAKFLHTLPTKQDVGGLHEVIEISIEAFCCTVVTSHLTVIHFHAQHNEVMDEVIAIVIVERAPDHSGDGEYSY